MTIGDTEFFLIGTAHVSKKSIAQVEAAIAELAPDLVCVELDRTRRDALAGKRPQLDWKRVVREGRAMFTLVHVVLSLYQKKIGKRLGVRPGAELLAAVVAAEQRAIPVELIDRDIDVTLRRTWANIGAVKRVVLGAGLAFAVVRIGVGGVDEATIENLKEKQALSEMLAELSKAMPEIKQPLIDERDAYMASRLAEVGAGKRRVVCVVGAAHVPGMVAELAHPRDRAGRAALEVLPRDGLATRVLRRIVPA